MCRRRQLIEVRQRRKVDSIESYLHAGRGVRQRQVWVPRRSPSSLGMLLIVIIQCNADFLPLGAAQVVKLVTQ